jgi:hypothetical protein
MSSEKYCTYRIAGKKLRFRYSDPIIGKIIQAYCYLGQIQESHEIDLIFTAVPPPNFRHDKLKQSAIGLLKRIDGSIPLQPSQSLLKFWDSEFLMLFSPKHKMGCCFYPQDLFTRPPPPSARFSMLFENTFDDTPLPPCSMSILKTIDVLLEFMGVFSIHAAFAQLHGQYILLPGEGASGKTTTALNIALNGGRLFADDRVFLGWNANRGVSAWPFHKKVAVTDRTIQFFPKISKHRTNENHYNFKYYFTEPDSLDPQLDSGCEPNLILFPVICKDANVSPTYKKLSYLESFKMFLNGKMIYPPIETAMREPQLDLLEALCSQSKIYAIYLSEDMDRNFGVVSALIDDGAT